MDIIYLLFFIVPGLIIYSVLRNESSISQKPEYVVLIYGIFGSTPFFAILSWILISLYGECTLVQFMKILNSPLYIFGYFLLICIYSATVWILATIWIRELHPWISKLLSKASKKNAHQIWYSSAWSKIYHDYMDKYRILVGRLLKDGKVVALGQIGVMTSDNSIFKDISFLYQEAYAAYFPEGQRPLLENLCNYVDLKTGYVLELYNGENQVALLKK